MQKIKKFLSGLTIALSAVLALSVWSCDDGYEPIDYSKMISDEIDLLEEYLDNNLDSLVQISLDTIHDYSQDPRWIYLEMVKGSGDSIVANRNVSLRYTLYGLGRDNEGLPAKYAIETRQNSMYPRIMVVNPEGWMRGVYLGLLYMKVNGESTIIIPSSLGNRQIYGYTTLIIELKVTAMES